MKKSQELIFEKSHYFPQRFLAAFFAISARRSGVMLLARATPPFLPSAFAAGSLPSSGIVSSISPVSTRMTRTALPITSAGRFSPLGPLGMARLPYGLSEMLRDRCHGALDVDLM